MNIETEDKLRSFVNREVYCCVSALVCELAEDEYEPLDKG